MPDLAWEPETRRNARHCGRHKMVEITVCWRRQLECSETDIVQSLVVNTECLVCVFNKLMDWQSGIVWLDNGVWHLLTTPHQAMSQWYVIRVCSIQNDVTDSVVTGHTSSLLIITRMYNKSKLNLNTYHMSITNCVLNKRVLRQWSTSTWSLYNRLIVVFTRTSRWN